MTNKNILGIEIENNSKSQVLEKILKVLNENNEFFHIVSLNPEIFVSSEANSLFKRVLREAQIRILDGIGTIIAAKMLSIEHGDRITGTDLMFKLLSMVNDRRLTVMLIGGKENIANGVVDCQKQTFPQVKFIAFQGISDIRSPKPTEEEKIFSIVADMKPKIIFSAFGSPYQELWFYNHRDRLKGTICMGVGGGFDFLSGSVRRAPLLFQKYGFEWLYRLCLQPWRIKRQLKLPIFLLLVFKQRLQSIFQG